MAANYAKYDDDDVVMNQSWHYSKCYDVWEVRPELTEILERHGDDKYHIFRKIIQFKNYLLLSEEKKFTAKIPSHCEAMLLDDLSKSCYLKINRRRKITEPLKCEFMDKIMLSITVLNELFFYFN